MLDYDIVIANDLSSFIVKVDDKLKEGWEPSSSLVIREIVDEHGPEKVLVYYQPITRPHSLLQRLWASVVNFYWSIQN